MRAIPDNRSGRILRQILTVVLIGAIIGIADQVRTLFWIVLTGEGPNPARVLIMLVGWGILGWCGYKAHRHNLAPPTWAIASNVLLTWVYLLWPS